MIWNKLSLLLSFNSSSALLRYSSQCASLSQTCSQHHSPIQGLCHASTSVCLEYVTSGCALCLTSHQDQLEYTMSQYEWWALREVPIDVHCASCNELNWIDQVAHVWEWNMYWHPAGAFSWNNTTSATWWWCLGALLTAGLFWSNIHSLVKHLSFIFICPRGDST